MKILIIEDELEIRETLRDLLELNGHTVLVAIDGPMGVNLAAEHPDLILCDIGMPGMNGYQVITAIKALPAGQDIPFVFLTAWADREHQRQGMTLGADDYITKPFTQSDILDAIAARMQRLRPLRERILALLADRRVVAQANWANELLPPFNGIMGGLEMIEEAADYIKPAELKDLLKIIRTNAHQQFALSRKLALHYELELDEGYLISAVAELVGNAFRFSVLGQPVTVTGRCHEARYLITVVDAGVGMTEAQCAAIGPFIQFARSDRDQQGLGLGLAIARSVAEIAGGHLHLQPGPAGCGLQVTLDLPCA